MDGMACERPVIQVRAFLSEAVADLGLRLCAGGARTRRGGVFVGGALLGLELLRARARLLVLLARLPQLGHGKWRALCKRHQGPFEVEAGLAVRGVQGQRVEEGVASRLDIALLEGGDAQVVVGERRKRGLAG